MTTAPIASDPIAALWQAAHDWLADTWRTFGPPERIARLARAALAALARELRALELLVLKLLLIEAAGLPGLAHAHAPARAASCPLMRCGCVSPRTSPIPNAPRFSLRLPQARTQSRRRSQRQRPRPARAPDPLDLARRCEALRRVLADPMPAVARLARKLHALGARAYAAARRIALLRPRRVPRAPMLYAHASVRAHDGACQFRGSG
jgi:hypothetical protein